MTRARELYAFRRNLWIATSHCSPTFRSVVRPISASTTQLVARLICVTRTWAFCYAFPPHVRCPFNTSCSPRSDRLGKLYLVALNSVSYSKMDGK